MNDLNEKLIGGQGKTLMTVFPHPDDESVVAGGLLAMARKAGWKTVVVSVTPGGAGRIHVKGNGRSLAQIRRDELLKAGRILGVAETEIGDFDDGRLRQEPWWKPWVDGMISKYNPDVVVTYDPSGFYGHPDHIAVSKYLYERFKKQTGWQLWYAAVSDLIRKRWKVPGMDRAAFLMVEPTHRLDYGWNFVSKWRAISAHKSQGLGKSLVVPVWLFVALYHFEWYHEVDKKTEYKFQFTDYKI